MEWENDQNAMALLGFYAGSGNSAQTRRNADSWLADAQAENSSTEADGQKWEIAEHATLIALGYLDIVSTELSMRGKPMGYKITPPGLLKVANGTHQELGLDLDRG